MNIISLPPNTTDRLQPMGVSVNKPAKAFMRKQFHLWYFGEIYSQLGEEIEDQDLCPVL